MTLSPQIRDELIGLIGSLVDDEQSPQQKQRLGELLATDAEARAFYVRYMSVHCELFWKHQAVPPEILAALDSKEVLSDEVPPAESVAPSPVETLKQSKSKPGRVTPRLVAAVVTGLSHPVGRVLAMVLVLTFCGLAAWLGTRPRQVAVVVQTSGIKWSPHAAARDGESLDAGRQLAVESGLAELRFGSGAGVILEGPATLVIESSSSVRLVEGRIAARVPPQAVGFTVLTPGATIVDLGTEFAVVVGRAAAIGDPTPANQNARLASSTEVHVFQGKIQLDLGASSAAPTPLNPQPDVLAAGQAVRLENSGKQVARIDSQPDNFVRHLPQPGESSTLLHDAFEANEPGAPLDLVNGWNVLYEADNAHQAQQIRVAEPTGTSPPSIGRRVVLLRDDFEGQAPNPVLAKSIPEVATARGISVSFDFRIIDPRTRPLLSLGRQIVIDFGPNLAVRGSGGSLASILPDRWYRLELSLPIKNHLTETCTLRLVDLQTQQEITRSTLRLTAIGAAAGNSPVLSKDGWSWGFVRTREQAAGGSYELDNIEIRAVTAGGRP